MTKASHRVVESSPQHSYRFSLVQLAPKAKVGSRRHKGPMFETSTPTYHRTDIPMTTVVHRETSSDRGPLKSACGDVPDQISHVTDETSPISHQAGV